jgi:lambda family phage minor tail protein L
MSTNKIINDDLRVSFIDSPLVELFELYLDIENDNDDVLRFHSGLDSSLGDIIFKGNSYSPLPVFLEGIDISSDNASARPTLTLANVSNVLKDLLNDKSFTFENLIGKKLTRRKTFEKYLEGGSDAANPFEFPKVSYYIDRISSRTSIGVSFELASPYDVDGIKLPRRVTVGKYCSWMYQGYHTHAKGGCTWRLDNTTAQGGTPRVAYFDSFDRPIVYSSAIVNSTPFDIETTYAINSVVTYDGKIYRNDADSNIGVLPDVSDSWTEVLVASNYVEESSYVENDLVFHNNKVWRCLIDTSSVEPGTSAAYWLRIDQCSKELSGCKARFQITFTVDGLPAAGKNTINPLPFGGFPGSEKFS